MSARVLGVEDEFVIGFDVSQQLADAGFSHGRLATEVDVENGDVAPSLSNPSNRFEVVGPATSEPIASKLRASGKPFVVLTGYSRDNLPPRCDDAAASRSLPVSAVSLWLCNRRSLICSSLPDGRIEYLNPRWLAYFDLRIKDALGDRWTVIIHPHDGDELIAKWDPVVRTRTLYEATARLRRYDGEYHWFIARANTIRDGRRHIIRWSGTCIEVGEEPQERGDAGKGSEILVRGLKTEAVLHFAPHRHAYRNSAGILNRYRDGEIGAVGLAKKVDQSLSARHLLDQGDQDRYQGAGSPARSAPGRPEQPTRKAHLKSGRRRFELPAGYPSTRAELGRIISFVPDAVKALRFGLKITRTEVADDEGQGIPDPCSCHVSTEAWRGKPEQVFSNRFVETTSSNVSRAPRTAMSGCAAKEL